MMIMKKIKLFISLFVATLCVATVFSSCAKDEVQDIETRDASDEVFEIRAVNVLHFSHRVASVRATLSRALYPDEFCMEELFNNAEFCCCGKVGGVLGAFEEIVIGEASFNSGFTMQLSNNIPDAFLQPVTRLYSWSNDKLDISNRDARISWWSGFGAVIGYCAAGEWIGRMQYQSDFFTRRRVGARFVFSDKDVTISGVVDSQVFNLSLKKGWNTVYGYFSGADGMSNPLNWTTQRPSGSNMIWTMPAYWRPAY